MSPCDWLFSVNTEIFFVFIYVITYSSDIFLIDSTLLFGYTTVKWTILIDIWVVCV